MTQAKTKASGRMGARPALSTSSRAPAVAKLPASPPKSPASRIDPELLKRWRAPTWRDYLLAWWEGYDTEALRRLARQSADESRSFLASSARRQGAAPPPPATAASPVAAPSPAPEIPPDPMESVRALEVTDLDRQSQPIWTVERVKSAELLWGPDVTGPSDPAWMVDAVRQFGLGPARSVLDLTAGLGGAARAISSAFDTWVTGLEPSPVLAAMAMQRSKAMGVSKKAPIVSYDPEHFAQAGSFDLIYGDRLLHKVRDKAFFLDRVTDCVKEKGGMLLFDYVVDGAPQSWDAWNNWRDAEPTDVSPWSARRFSDELVQRNFDVRVNEDLTELHRRQILSRIDRLSAALGTADVSGGMLGAIARELAVWWARLKVLGRGLCFHRFVAYRA